MKKLRKSSKGLFDLPSIMVGIIITAILGLAAAATFFVVIPWLQDNQARDVLTSIQVAETTARQDLGQYTDYTTLQNNGWLVKQKLNVCVTPSGNTYKAFVISASGKVFQLDSATGTSDVFTGTKSCTPA